MPLWKEFESFIPESVVEAFKKYYGAKEYFLWKGKQTEAVRKKLEVLETSPAYTHLRRRKEKYGSKKK